MVAHVHSGHALAIGALKLCGQTGQGRQFPTQLVVILIRAVSTIIVSVAQLPQWDAFVVLALELAGDIAFVVLADRVGLVREVSTVVIAIAHEVGPDANSVVALEHVLTVKAPGESGRAVELVRNVVTILVSVAHESFEDAVSTGAFELVLFAFVIQTIFFVTSILAIVVVIAPPP